MKKEIIDLYFLKIKYKSKTQIPGPIYLSKKGPETTMKEINIEEEVTYKKDSQEEIKILLDEKKLEHMNNIISYQAFKQSYVKDLTIFNETSIKVNWDFEKFCVFNPLKNSIIGEEKYIYPKKYRKSKKIKI